MAEFSYLTLASSSEGLFKEKGSKFLSFAIPVSSEAEIRDKLDLLKKKYFDARHHCYAYILWSEPENKSRVFDAGEPNHAAGDPILGKIRARNLANVLVVVIRYFGGVKLGVGGLVQAYKAAAEEALKIAVVTEHEITKLYRIDYDFNASPEVMRLIKECDLRIIHQEFADGGSMEVELKIRNRAKFLERTALLIAMKVSIRYEPV